MQYLLVALIFIAPALPFCLYLGYEIATERAYAKGHDAAWEQAKWAQDTGRRIV